MKVSASEENVMNAVAIDSNMLTSLFDNQKKLDDLFDTIFDDDNYFIGSSSSSSQAGSRQFAADLESQISVAGRNVKASPLATKHNPFCYVLPIVLEIAVIYLVVINLL